MFNKSIVLAATMIVAGGLALSGPASAGHRMFMPSMGGDMGGMQHSMMGGGMGNMGDFHRGGGDGWRHDHDHDHFRFYGPAFLGFGYAPYFDDYAYGDDYYPSYSYAYDGSAHARWCLDHHHTYDPRSNTYIGGDGYRHSCRG